MRKIVSASNEKLAPSQLEEQGLVGEASGGVPLSCPGTARCMTVGMIQL